MFFAIIYPAARPLSLAASPKRSTRRQARVVVKTNPASEVELLAIRRAWNGGIGQRPLCVLPDSSFLRLTGAINSPSNGAQSSELRGRRKPTALPRTRRPITGYGHSSRDGPTSSRMRSVLSDRGAARSPA